MARHDIARATVVMVSYTCVRCATVFQRPSNSGGPRPKYCSRLCKLRKRDDYLLVASGVRRCKECLETKPLSDFWARRGNRFVAHSRCKVCMATKARAWYVKNRAARIAAATAYAKVNRESLKSYKAAKAAQRRASELQATPSWLTAIQNAQIAEFYEIAAARQVQTGLIQHVDHVVPLQGKKVRGLHVPWNLQILTEAENCSKHNGFVERP